MAENKVEREAKMTIILGANGTGKTTLLENILLSTPEKCLVITPDDAEWRKYDEVELTRQSDFLFTGIRRHIFDPDKKKGTLTRIDKFVKGKIIFDDCRAYLLSSTELTIRQLMIRRRQRMVDVFAVGHGFTEVPPVFFRFTTEIILFKTKDNIIKRKNEIRDEIYPQMVEAQTRVNRKAEKDPHYFEIIKFS